MGIKTAHFGKPGWTAIDRAVAAGRLANVPVMVDSHIFTNSQRTTREELLDHLRPGDIRTHMFNDRQIELVDRITGKVEPWVIEARRRGVRFDVGHGGGSFLWPVASRAIAQGFFPDTISTDLHDASIFIQQCDMPNVMSKLMFLGMNFNDVLLRSTVNPAKEIARYPELGTLGRGAHGGCRGTRTAERRIRVQGRVAGQAPRDEAPGLRADHSQRSYCLRSGRAGISGLERDTMTSRFLILALACGAVQGQQIYDLLLKNGHVIDPANGRDARLDVAIAGNKIARVAPDLPAANGRVVVDVGAYIVSPGLIDINANLDLARGGVRPDYHMLPNGVTTAVDSSETCATLADFKKRVMNRAKTRILAFVSDRGAGCEDKAVVNRGEVPATTALRFGAIQAALKKGMPPDTISSGVDAANAVLQGANLLTAMSIYLNLGMTPQQILERVTTNAARAIERPELGALNEGSAADVAVLEIQEGKFGLLDSGNERLDAKRRFRCVLTVRNGAIVWDTGGLSIPDSLKAGPYTNFK